MKYAGVSLMEEIYGVGVVVNLSTTGLYFTTKENIELGTMLRCFLYMTKGNRLIKIRCEGHVVRTDECKNCWNIAISLTTLQW